MALGETETPVLRRPDRRSTAPYLLEDKYSLMEVSTRITTQLWLVLDKYPSNVGVSFVSLSLPLPAMALWGCFVDGKHQKYGENREKATSFRDRR